MDTSPNEPASNPQPEPPFHFCVTDLLIAIAWLAGLLAIGMQVRPPWLCLSSVVAWYVVFLAIAKGRNLPHYFHVVFFAAAIMAFIASLTPAVIDAREAARRSTCKGHMAQIGLALANYEDMYGCLPPAYIADAQGKPMHSWRVLILPCMGQDALYARYNFNEPWDGPNNKKLHSTLVGVYSCLSDNKNPGTDTSYVAVVGPGTAWPGATSTSKSMVTDGLSNSILLVEVANSGIHWMEPRDLPVAAVSAGINPKSGLGISSAHPGGVNVSLMDWQHIFLSETTPVEVLNALLTIRGGERLSNDGVDYTILPPVAKPQSTR